MSNTRLGHFATPSIQRDIIELAGWGISPDANGLFVLADDTPLRLVGMVEGLCERESRYDFKMVSDI